MLSAFLCPNIFIALVHKQVAIQWTFCKLTSSLKISSEISISLLLVLGHVVRDSLVLAKSLVCEPVLVSMWYLPAPAEHCRNQPATTFVCCIENQPCVQFCSDTPEEAPLVP